MIVVGEDELVRRLASLPEGARVVAGGNHAAPLHLLSVVDRTLARWRLFMLNAPVGIQVREGVTLETPFVGAGMRDRPSLEYVPSRLSLVPALFRTTRVPDAVVVHATPPREGRLSLGIEVNVLPAAIEAVRRRRGLVVAQVNPRMPYTLGDGEIRVEDVDVAVEVDEPLACPEPVASRDTAADIGERVAALVPDGATLQAGIGAIPDATLASLRRHGLRVWSEMFSDGVLALDRAGLLDTADPITASFCFGSEALYEFVDRNPRVRIVRTETANDPGLIARRPLMTSINSAMQVDLFAQANAQRCGGRIYSGFGGQTDFIVGALHSPGGQALLALPSWHAKTATSTIVPQLDGPVTSFQHSAIVTEQGTAHVWGSSQAEQAYELVERAAHPAARDELRAAARRLGLSTRGHVEGE